MKYEELEPSEISPEQRVQRAKVWYGLRPHRHNRSGPPRKHTFMCPRTLAVGKRCIGWSKLNPLRPDGGAGGFDDLCICARYFGNLLDHALPWVEKSTGEIILIGEPYSLGTPELRSKFLSECRALGLSVEFNEESPYWPGRTYGVWIRRAK